MGYRYDERRMMTALDPLQPVPHRKSGRWVTPSLVRPGQKILKCCTRRRRAAVGSLWVGASPRGFAVSV